MTDFDDALVNHLLSRPGLAALVANRIYPDYFPQSGQLPAVAYTIEDDSSGHMMQGASGLRRAIYQINVWAETRREVMTVARQICKALSADPVLAKGLQRTGFSDGSATKLPPFGNLAQEPIPSPLAPWAGQSLGGRPTLVVPPRYVIAQLPGKTRTLANLPSRLGWPCVYSSSREFEIWI